MKNIPMKKRFKVIFVLCSLALCLGLAIVLAGSKAFRKIELGWSDSQETNLLDTQENMKKIKFIAQSHRSTIGPMEMKQPLPSQRINQMDPFLLLHHHGPQHFPPQNDGLPFGPHPHRGFETITFIFHGDVKHEDSNGFKSVIRSGGVQWMAAAGGIVHSERSSEEFLEKGGKVELIQLWTNLPASQKKKPSKYLGLQKEEIPVVSLENGQIEIQVVSGAWNEVKGPGDGYYPVAMYSIEMKAGSQLSKKFDPEENVLLYLREGRIAVNNTELKPFQMPVFEDGGEEVRVEALEDSKLILGAARPIKEPVVSQGPFVMNTQEELYEAIMDYQQGKMGSLEE